MRAKTGEIPKYNGDYGSKSWELRRTALARSLQLISTRIGIISPQELKDNMFHIGQLRPDFSVSSPHSATAHLAIGGPWGINPITYKAEPNIPSTLADLSDNPTTQLPRNLLFDILCYDGSRDCAFLDIAQGFERTPGFTISTCANISLLVLASVLILSFQ